MKYAQVWLWFALLCLYMYNPILYIDGLVQESRNSTASALELRLSCQ